MTLQEFYSEWCSDDLYVNAHTSGSTGKPKAIQLLKSDMRASAKATNEFFNVKDGDNLVCPLSLDYIAGKMMVVRAELADANLVLQTPSNQLNISCDTKLLAIVPSQVESLLSRPDLYCKIKNIIIGGAPLSDELRKRLASAGLNAYETYGMTETCSHVALRHISQYCFTAIPGATFDVDSRGCLIVNVPYMSVGRVITNDVVELVGTTSFKWLGRYDNVINSGGIKIYPETLERQIVQIIGDKYIFFIGSLPHPVWGEEIVMYIESTQEVADAVYSKLRDVLDHKLLPKKIIAVKEILRTPNGKLKRQIIG